MKNLKLISVRLDQETLQKIDELSEKYDDFTRSSIINNLLSSVLNCASGVAIWRMISESWLYEKGYVIKVEKDAYVLKERNKPRYDD